MSQNFFQHHTRDMMVLGGWLFADLLLGLMIIFMGAIPPIPLSPPPTLVVSPTTLSMDQNPCSGGRSTPQCTITIGESATSQGTMQWSAWSDMGKGIIFSAESSLLSPGKSTQVTISAIPCQNGSLIFTGSRNAAPVVVTWQCTPLPERLEPDSQPFTLTVNNPQDLLNNSQQAIDDIKQQVRGKSVLAGRDVGLAIVSVGAPDDASSAEAQRIAGKIYDIFRQLGHEGFAFQRSSYYANLFFLGKPLNVVDVDVYLFCTDKDGAKCNKNLADNLGIIS